MPKIKNTPKVSIVIPAKDEEENIDILLQRLKKVSSKIKGFKKSDFEVIVVCDNCIDNTEERARKYGVKTIRRRGNSGKSKALIDGFKKAKGEILVMMDADLSHLPEELPQMIEKLFSRKEIGLVIASRELGKSEDATLIRRMGGIGLNFFTDLFLGTSLTDAINGYKIFYRHIFDNHDYKADGYAIEIELIANTLREGLVVTEVPSLEPKRAGGVAKSKVIKDGWIFFREILTEGFQYNLERLKKLDFGKEVYEER